MRRHDRTFAVLAFLLPLALYALTAHRGIGLPDWAVLADAARRLEPSVAAWNHPLANLLGWLVTRGAPPEAFPSRLVWISILPMAAAIGLFALALVRAGVPRILALACALAHATGHSAWWHGTVAENYAIGSLFVSLALYAGVRLVQEDAGQPSSRASPALCLLCFTASLALANHIALGVLGPGCIPWLLHAGRRRGARAVFPALLAGLLGLTPFLALLVRDILRHPDALSLLAGGGFRSQMFQPLSGTEIARRLADLWTLEHPTPFALAAGAGFVLALVPILPAPLFADRQGSPEKRTSASAGRAFRWHCSLLALPTALFALSYGAWDRFAFFLPVFAVSSFLGSLLLARVRLPGKRAPLLRGLRILLPAASVLLAFGIYPRIPAWSKSGSGYWAKRFGAIARDYEHRGDLVGMLADPVFHDRGSLERTAAILVATAPHGALVVDDMAFQHSMEWIARLPSVDRPDLDFVSVVPPFLEGHGLEPRAAAARIAFHDAPVLLTTTNGLCGEALSRLRPYGRSAEAVELPEGRRAFRIRP
ncbi:MAG: protein O-mannosyl-transferase family [Kiritimatiellia bacterium]|jgi:hypothetical protein